MRALFLLALVSLTAQADDHRGRFERFCSRTDQGRTNRGFLCDSLAFFEAFPANGAGTSGACSTTPPTGAKGEALTFTRASNGTCTKTAAGGLATTGIANGDLVVLSSNQPRVEYDSGGVLGLLVEASRTNSLLRSQEINDAAWTKGTAVGTITANYATAPDGTLTADRYQYSNTNNDYILQSFTVSGLAAAGSVYLKGTSGSGTLNICRGGAVGQCVTCAYVSTSWSRCVYAATLAGSANVFIGCETATLGGACAQTGFDVLVWGLQGELGAYATSYIPTTSATVTRGAETASFNGSTWPTATYSAAATVARMANTNGAVLDGITSGGVGLLFFSGLRQRHSPGPTDVSGAISFTANAPSRFAAAYTGATGQVFQDGVSVAGPAAQTVPSAWPSSVYLGFWSVAASTADGIYSRVCVDPDPSRCR